MNLAESNVSIVSVVGPNVGKCGYCQGKDTSHTFGVWAYYLTCEDYQQLIDKGWRRSGEYVYKPNLRTSCCPQYAIKLDASKFKPSKSQKKLVHKFNRFVQGDWTPNSEEDVNTGNKKPQQKSEPAGMDTLPTLLSRAEHTSNDETERPKKYELEIEMEPSSFTAEKYSLYRKYQIGIHHDPPSKLKEKSFRQFLVDSPLKRYSFNRDDGAPCSGYGSYHQTYRLDGKLIAMAVLDILPNCVSSVYFMYDPEYAFLSLGKYSALREIALTQEFEEKVSKELHWYYMGYYIHSCTKMRYKGQYKPSYLLDSEAATWEPIEKCVPLLDKTGFVPFHKALMGEATDMDSTSANGVDSISNSANCLRSVLAIFSGMLAPITVSFVAFQFSPTLDFWN
ncbi:hypothetical protein K450DRAFT_231963, partial [Umbelopsis ramanniana AG]